MRQVCQRVHTGLSDAIHIHTNWHKTAKHEGVSKLSEAGIPSLKVPGKREVT